MPTHLENRQYTMPNVSQKTSIKVLVYVLYVLPFINMLDLGRGHILYSFSCVIYFPNFHTIQNMSLWYCIVHIDILYIVLA